MSKHSNSKLQPRHYSESFKKHVVEEVESGRLGKEEAKYKYNIGGNSCVLNWMRKYGKEKNKHKNKEILTLEKTGETAYKRRIKELEEELSSHKLRNTYLECLLEELEKTGVSIGKKSVILPLQQPKKKSKE